MFAFAFWPALLEKKKLKNHNGGKNENNDDVGRLGI
jgi:hypothetical protein